MKILRNYSLVIFFIVMFASSRVWAQDYAVTIKGDTLVGFLKPIVYGADRKLQVTEPNKKKTVLALHQIKSYSLKGETFKPVKGPAGYAFMKLLKTGYVSLYAFQPENQTTYDGRFLTKKDGTGTEVPNLSFKKIMSRFLEDCADVAAKIESGDLSKKELDQIIDQYNQCMNVKTSERQKIMATRVEQGKKISAWDVLQEKVNAEATFEGKTNALEMIGEIKSKISKSEKVPNFLTSGLKSTLTQPGLQDALTQALLELE